MITLKANDLIKNLIDKNKLSLYELSSLLDVDIKSINNYLNNETLSDSSILKLSEYLKSANINLFNYLGIDDNKYYYHASKTTIKGKISANHNKTNINDFGYGFYLSESLKVSLSYVCDENDPHIYCFKRNNIDNINKYIFNGKEIDTIDWVLYIGLNRKKIKEKSIATLLNEKYHEKFNKYECLVGKITDSYNWRILDDFFKNVYDINQVKKALIKADLGNQFVIKSETVSNNLKADLVIKLDPKLKKLISIYKNDRNIKIINDNSKGIDTNKTKEGLKFSSIIKGIK